MLPDISEADILDKSKANILAKSLVSSRGVVFGSVHRTPGNLAYYQPARIEYLPPRYMLLPHVCSLVE